jgi:spermidine/putrescine transport system permease protein
MENTIENPQEEIQADMYLKPKFKVSWQVVFAVLMFFYMYLPILVLTFYSFNKSRFSAGWEGLL